MDDAIRHRGDAYEMLIKRGEKIPYNSKTPKLLCLGV